ncbi:MAG: glycosyltransferase [Propionibacteriaceae bacterium]|nr:glycosyltransferase [Propionibacteriaceae bacterium]
MTARMIFHHPLPLDPDATSASGIRPQLMREAFSSLGYEVWDVIGHTSERRERADEVRHALRGGVGFEFCYSESSTMPMTMTNPNHLPIDPWLDVGFFRHLRSHGVPVGHFLRDIFWRFPGYREDLSWARYHAAITAYRFDMWALRHHVDHVFLPSLPMAQHVNLGRTPVSTLPPGHAHDAPIKGPETGVSLFYVGGLGAHYDLTELFSAVRDLHDKGLDVALTVCLRPDDWAQVKDRYTPLMNEATQIVHAHGAGLRQHFERANIAALLVEPKDYWQLAVPVKLYDYVGAGKPVLATRGTLTGEIVQEQGLGWSIDHEPAAIRNFLAELATAPERIRSARDAVIERRDAHTWRHRAEQVVSTLRPVDIHTPR